MAERYTTDGGGKAKAKVLSSEELLKMRRLRDTVTHVTERTSKPYSAGRGITATRTDVTEFTPKKSK